MILYRLNQRGIVNESLTQSVVDLDGLFDVCRVRFASSIYSKDPEDIFLSISQACHHIMEVGTLLWRLIGWIPLHSTGLLILNEVSKDPAFSIVPGQLPLQAD